MRFDDVLGVLGDFGKFQKILYFFACLPILFIAMQIMSPIFILAVPKHRCTVPGLDNDTYAIQDEHHRILVENSIPKIDDGYSKCDVYVHPTVESNITIATNSSIYTAAITNRSKTSCSSWVYDKSVFKVTVISEADLVCSRIIYRAHATTAAMVGSLFGYLLMGPLSDWFGRKKTYVLELLLLGFAAIFIIWLPNVYVYIATRFVLGIGMGAAYNVNYVYVLEFIGPSKRLLWGLVVNHVWAVGMFLHAGIAYGLRDWRHLQLATSVPVICFLTYWRVLPESPRWLFARDKVAEGKDIVTKMARTNGVKFDVKQLHNLEVTDDASPGTSLKELLRSRTLTHRTVIVSFNWLVVSMLYYGLSLNVGNLVGDVYLNYLFSALMEFLAYTLCIPAIYKMGRKGFHSSCMILSGLSLLLTPLPLFYGAKSSQWSVTFLAMLGKLSTSAAYATIILYSNELFPTTIRTTVIGLSSFSSGIGGVLAPYMVELANLLDGRMAAILPLLVFGVSSLSAGMLSLCLPDTSNKQLPDSIIDAKNFGKRLKGKENTTIEMT